MFKTRFVFSVLALLTIAAVGCSAKIDGGSAPAPAPAAPAGSASTTVAPATPSVLEGKWATGCVGQTGFYLTASFSFVGNTASGAVKVYSDAACTQFLQEQDQTATFTIGGDATLAGAKNIDMVDSAGNKTYSIFKIDGDTLYQGNAPGTTEATRSTDLNMNMPFKKVN